jgi:hypothetical protein
MTDVALRNVSSLWADERLWRGQSTRVGDPVHYRHTLRGSAGHLVHGLLHCGALVPQSCCNSSVEPQTARVLSSRGCVTVSLLTGC